MKKLSFHIVVVLFAGIGLFACESKPGSQLDLGSLEGLDAALAKDSNQADLLYRRSKILLQQGKPSRAAMDISRALNLDSSNSLYQFQMAEVDFLSNKTRKAEYHYRKAIVLNPGFTEARLKLGEMYYIVKEHRSSMEAFDTVLQEQPYNVKALFFKGMNYADLRDTAKAIFYFRKVVEVEPGHPQANMKLGLIFSEKKAPIAADYFSNILRANPADKDALFARAVFYQTTGKKDLAAQDYDKLITIDPLDARVYYNLGYLNFEDGDLDRAIENFNQAIGKDPSYARALYQRGLSYELKKDLKRAAQDYDRCLQVDPGFTLALDALNRLNR